MSIAESKQPDTQITRVPGQARPTGPLKTPQKSKITSNLEKAPLRPSCVFSDERENEHNY